MVVALKPGLDLPPLAGAVLHTWILPEPDRWDVDGIRPLRDHLAQRIRALLDTLGRTDTAASGPITAMIPTITG